MTFDDVTVFLFLYHAKNKGYGNRDACMLWDVRSISNNYDLKYY